LTIHRVWIKVVGNFSDRCIAAFFKTNSRKKGIGKMSPGGIFVQGIISVFFGMALLYLSIKITAFAVDSFAKKNKGAGKDGK
jgi:hypothetical protein